MIHPAPVRPPVAGQEIDELIPEAKLNERGPLVDVVHRAAQRLGVEATRGLLVLHAQHHMVQPQRLEESHGRRITSARRSATPAVITMPFRTPESRCRRANLSVSAGVAPAPACHIASRAAWAAGSTTTQA